MSLRLRPALTAGAALAACFLFGFSARDLQRGDLPSGRALKLLFGIQAAPPAASPERIFRDNYHRIIESYTRKVDPLDLKYAGIDGMMASLGDPHTVFLAPKAAQAFNEETRANFFGVGASLNPDPMGAKVQTAFEDGPAFFAGLRDGDLITAVDGKSVGGMELPDIVDKIKGKEGTTVRLTVLKKDAEKPAVLTIRRARIIAPTVQGKMLEGKVGYLSVLSFAEPTAIQFDKELGKLERQGADGLVIDLRANPGGLLETAVDMLSRFVSNKVVVRMKFRDGAEEVATTYPGVLHDFSYPVVVLIDENSASAAEIFAGCLRDYGRATLVGDHSYGKASVQNVFPLVDRASAKVTIAKYYLPSSGFIGRRVDEDGAYLDGGLKPDVAVKLDTDKEVVFGDLAVDNQLAAAVDLVKAKR